MPVECKVVEDNYDIMLREGRLFQEHASNEKKKGLHYCKHTMAKQNQELLQNYQKKQASGS